MVEGVFDWTSSNCIPRPFPEIRDSYDKAMKALKERFEPSSRKIR